VGKNHTTSTFIFFMKDRVVSEHIEIRYCPTGSLFKCTKRVIIGLDHISTLWISGPSPTEEHVEEGGDLSLGNRPGNDNKARPVSSFVDDPRTNVSSLVRGKARTKIQK